MLKSIDKTQMGNCEMLQNQSMHVHSDEYEKIHERINEGLKWIFIGLLLPRFEHFTNSIE